MALSTGLRAYWKLDEASGNAIDVHASFDLTDHGTVGTATGKVNGARSFAVANDEALYDPTTTNFRPGDADFTIQFWIKFSGFADFSIPLCKDDGGGNREYAFYYYNGLSRLIFLVASGGSPTEVTANTFGALSTGTWYLVHGWHDAVNNQIGIAINAGTPNTTSHAGGVDQTAAEFTIGQRNRGGSFNTRCDALIDEVGFWDRVLTSAERTELYNGGAGLAYSSFGGGGGAITGTGGVTIARPAISAAGSAVPPAITGTGGIAISRASLAGAGASTPPGVSGSGGLTIGRPALAAAGTFTAAPSVSGSGGVVLGRPALAAAGTFTAPGIIAGSGALTVSRPGLAATGTFTAAPSSTGSGGVLITTPAVAAAGTVSAPGATGTAAVTVARPALAATGTFTAAPSSTGTAAVTIDGPAIAAAGTVAAPGASTGQAAVTIGRPGIAAAGTAALPPITSGTDQVGASAAFVPVAAGTVTAFSTTTAAVSYEATAGHVTWSTTSAVPTFSATLAVVPELVGV